MRWLVRIRIELARKPWLVWALVVTLCTCAAGVAYSELSKVRAARSAWGDQRDVFVATRAIAAGTPVEGSGIEGRRVPRAMVPEGAPTQLDATAIVTRDLVPGEIVVAADIGVGDPRFTLVPAGDVVVALPRSSVLPPLRPGDRVRVTVTADAATSISVEAVVASLSADAVLVAVGPGDAPAVAAASTDEVHPPVIVLVPAQR